MRILDEIDAELGFLEDVARGSIGDSITRIRMRIQSLKITLDDESRSKVLGLVYAEAISGDITQEQFFQQLTEIINE
jgi:hypothetical protein